MSILKSGNLALTPLISCDPNQLKLSDSNVISPYRDAALKIRDFPISVDRNVGRAAPIRLKIKIRLKRA
jgi:hypothetical protein